jgi:hypothetical protein
MIENSQLDVISISIRTTEGPSILASAFPAEAVVTWPEWRASREHGHEARIGTAQHQGFTIRVVEFRDTPTPTPKEAP